jgi:hypothetical protein
MNLQVLDLTEQFQSWPGLQTHPLDYVSSAEQQQRRPIDVLVQEERSFFFESKGGDVVGNFGGGPRGDI